MVGKICFNFNDRFFYQKNSPKSLREWKHSEKETIFFFLGNNDWCMVKLLVAVTLIDGFQLRKLQFFHRATGHVSDESSEVQVGAPDSAPSFL